MKSQPGYKPKPRSYRHRAPYQENLTIILFLTVVLTFWFQLLKLPLYLGYMAGINLIAFGYYGYDKRQAKKEKWRVPELILYLLALLGGVAGALIGMLVFNHKTRKQRFLEVLSVSLLLHVLIFVVIVLFFDPYLLTYNDWFAGLRTNVR